MKKIAIIGRENVGKSTLFNKLCQKELSIVNNQPGVTRDYIKHIGKLFDTEFELIDTAGWYLNKNKKVIPNVRENTKIAVDEVDIIFFVVDAKSSLSEEDLTLARSANKLHKKIVLLANKSELNVFLSQDDLKKLGLGLGTFISAEHKLGFDQIYQLIKDDIDKDSNISNNNDESLSIAIIGRPNVGKSTLFNSILGFEKKFGI